MAQLPCIGLKEANCLTYLLGTVLCTLTMGYIFCYEAYPPEKLGGWKT